MDQVIKVEQPTPPRHTIASNANRLIITIPAKAKWYFFPFMIVWLAGWIMMSLWVVGLSVLMLIGSLVAEEKASGGWIFALFLIPFILFLYGVGRFGWGTFFWYIAGREVIQVDREYLTISNQVWRWKKTRTYDLAMVRNFQVKLKPDGWLSILRIQPSRYRRETISFDYGVKAQYFGKELDDAEARQIIAEIAETIATISA